MDAFKKTLIILFLTLFSGIIVLGILLFLYYGNVAYGVHLPKNVHSINELKTYSVLVVTGLLSLLAVIFYLTLHNFNQTKKVQTALLESEERFRLLVQEVKDYAIFMIDPEGKVMSWNQGAEHIKGYSASEVIGKPISLFYTDEENLRGEPAHNLKRAREEGRFESVGWRKRKDGSLFFADVFFTALYDDDHKLRGFAKITRDITEQQKAEEEIRNALKQEKALNEMKSRFVTLASHEFSTPLSVILSSVSLIERYQEPGMEDKRLKHILRIKSNVNNLKQILNDFLSVEKLEGDIVRNCPVDTDLVQLTHETIEDMEAALKQNQRIHLHTTGSPGNISADTQLLRNILNNLLSNAIKYSPENASIDCTLSYLAGSVEIHIRDRGIGIPAGEQEHLFERFFRATNTAGISGTGLGLSIVKKYLDLMGGSIHLKSAPEGGSIFTVILPSELREINNER